MPSSKAVDPVEAGCRKSLAVLDGVRRGDDTGVEDLISVHRGHWSRLPRVTGTCRVRLCRSRIPVAVAVIEITGSRCMRRQVSCDSAISRRSFVW